MNKTIEFSPTKRFIISEFEQGETKGLNIQMQIKTKKKPEWTFTNKGIFLNTDNPQAIKELGVVLKKYAKSLEE